jgi:hypothetical protein
MLQFKVGAFGAVGVLEDFPPKRKSLSIATGGLTITPGLGYIEPADHIHYYD